MSTKPNSRRAVVIGAGPVGCLAGIALAKQGWAVSIYERRPDPRFEDADATQRRSINLTLSARGIAAVQHLDPGASDRLVEAAVPLTGRMVHGTDGRVEAHDYDRRGKGALYSLERALLNAQFVERASMTPGVSLHFAHKLEAAEFDARTVCVRPAGGEPRWEAFDLCVGADGCHSAVRGLLMKYVRMDYEQLYIPHDYFEVRVPARVGADGKREYKLDPNHTHVWPRQSFMLVAFPNQDKSFTCTLFAPHDELQHLTTPELSLRWFKRHFADAVELIGDGPLLEQLANNPRNPLIALKTKPYHYRDRVIILGDAAHAMVPFYGQGLNCGLEDVRVLDFLLRKHDVRPHTAAAAAGGAKGSDADAALARALAEYSATRHADIAAMSALAHAHYAELRHNVATLRFRVRKAVDDLLYGATVALARGAPRLDPWAAPAAAAGCFAQRVAGWTPLYAMVTFRPDISYSTAVLQGVRQTRILLCAVWSLLAVLVVTCSLLAVAL